MSQISLGDIPNQSQRPANEMSDSLCLLMNGIANHSVEEDQNELSRFQEAVTTETARVQAASDASQVKPAVEAVIQLLADHNKGLRAHHRAHAEELSQALRMMVETIGHVGKSSQAAVHQLSVIEKNLEEVTATDDAKNLRVKLGVCLKMIRDQSESLQVQSNEHINQLKAFVASTASAQNAALPEEPLDPVTGLPGRSFTESLIEEKFVRKTDCLVGVIRVDRLSSFLSKYQQPAVDDVMKTAARQLAQRLPVGTTLCRWSQNAFIAITEITSSYAESAQQWRKVGGLKIEKNFEDGAKSAYVALTTSLMVEHLRVMASKRGLIQNIDRFAGQQSGELAA